MSAVQTSVSLKPDAGVPGLPADSNVVQEFVSRVATVDIPFGAFVSLVDENECKLPTTSAEVTTNGGGVAVFDQTKASQAGYKAGDVVTIMRKGNVYVSTEQTCAASGAAFVRFTDGTLGAFRADADTSDAVAASIARFAYGRTGAGLVVVTLNIPA